MKRFEPKKRRKTDKQLKKILKRQRSCQRFENRRKERIDKIALENRLDWEARQEFLKKMKREEKARRFIRATEYYICSTPTASTSNIFVDW